VPVPAAHLSVAKPQHSQRAADCSETSVADFNLWHITCHGQVPELQSGRSQKSCDPRHTRVYICYMQEHNICASLCIGCIVVICKTFLHVKKFKVLGLLLSSVDPAFLGDGNIQNLFPLCHVQLKLVI
jgi:hypothetical protein